MSLLRDVIADYYDDVLGATCFIEKATVNVNDPAIYNKEGFTANQILTRKDILYDKSGCPWIVGYLPKNYPSGEQTGVINFNYFDVPNVTVENIEEWDGYDELGEYVLSIKSAYVQQGYTAPYKDRDIYGLRLNCSPTALTPAVYGLEYTGWETFPSFVQSLMTVGKNPTLFKQFQTENRGSVVVNYENNFIKTVQTAIDETNKQGLYNAVMTYAPKLATTQATIADGTIIYDSGTNVYYRVKSETGEKTKKVVVKTGQDAIWYHYLSKIFSFENSFNNNRMTTNSCEIEINYYHTTYSLETIGLGGNCTITQNRTHLYDQPYDMFCIPYSDDIQFRYKKPGEEEDTIVSYKKGMAMSFAQNVASDLGKDAIYDIQILPYCPAQYLIKTDEDGTYIEDNGEGITQRITGEDNEVIGAIIWLSKSSFSFTIPYNIALDEKPIGRKIQAICDKYRICSPNMSSFFDFDPVKNNGVSEIEVDCYYKPYTPYIHLNPIFSGLYANTTFEYEVRGLDLSGNFSLTQISNAWTDYQLQNKNYQEIFNRQQSNLTKLHSYEMMESGINALVGTAGSAGAGYVVGGVPGAIIGGAVSLGGGIGDQFLQEAKYKETLNYNKAMYDFQLQNIQALPQSLTKVDTLSPNNPLVPYIEYYTCSDIEKNAIRNNLYYGGMTIGRIGSLNEFKTVEPSFMKA